MKKTCILFFVFLLSFNVMAKDHLIYSISEEIPMGYENEIIKKNFYLNIGTNQGVDEGTTLDVFRVISRSNPYENLKIVNYKVKIGEIQILHSDDEAAIGIMKNIKSTDQTPLMHLEGFMIGDLVSVNTK